jgi:hypothetical protein
VNKFDRVTQELAEGKKSKMKAHGPSMKPLIESGSTLTFEATNDYQINDVVLTKVSGNWMVHKITKIGSDGRYMISNNRGRENGWTRQVYGRVIAVNDKPFGRQ